MLQVRRLFWLMLHIAGTYAARHDFAYVLSIYIVTLRMHKLQIWVQVLTLHFSEFLNLFALPILLIDLFLQPEILPVVIFVILQQ